MKKLITFITTTMLITSMFTGLTATGATKAAKGGSTITFMASQGWVNEAEKDLMTKFETETGTKIDLQVVPADQYFNVLLTKLNSGEAPDIFMSQSGKFDIVSQLNIEKNGVDLSNEEWVKRMDPLAAEQLSVGKKVYGQIVFNNTPTFPVMYSKKIFAKLGISIPKNYLQFKAACIKIQKAGITPVYEPVSDGWHHVLWFPDLGGRFEQAAPGFAEKLNTNKAKFADSKIMLQDLTQLQEMAKLGFFGKNYLSDTVADTDKNMASGKYAMTLAQFSEADAIAKAVPGAKASDYGFFTPPLADNQIAPVNPAGPSRFIYSGSKKIADAKKYLAFIAKNENLNYLVEKDSTISVITFKGVKNKLSVDANKFMNTYKHQGTVYQTQIKYLNPQWMDMGKDITAMFTGALKPIDILKNIDKRRVDQAKAANDATFLK